MNREEYVSCDPIVDKEDPTDVAGLFIRLVPQDAGNQQFKRSAGFKPRLKKDRAVISSARRRVHAALEAETAAVPEAGAEIIDRELSQIMSPRPAANDPASRQSARRLSGDRRSSLVEAMLGSPVRASRRSSPDDQEPTAAAELHITLVHG
jgi:hypothetical protein